MGVNFEDLFFVILFAIFLLKGGDILVFKKVFFGPRSHSIDDSARDSGNVSRFDSPPLGRSEGNICPVTA